MASTDDITLYDEITHWKKPDHSLCFSPAVTTIGGTGRYGKLLAKSFQTGKISNTSRNVEAVTESRNYQEREQNGPGRRSLWTVPRPGTIRRSSYYSLTSFPSSTATFGGKGVWAF